MFYVSMYKQDNDLPVQTINEPDWVPSTSSATTPKHRSMLKNYMQARLAFSSGISFKSVKLF